MKFTFVLRVGGGGRGGEGGENFNSMAERLRARSGKKLSYNEDANQADWETEEREKVEIRKTPTKKKKQKAEACTVCSKKESLIFCPGCQEAYHPGCLFPPLKVAPHSKWSCPQCVDPLSDIEKFLDRQDRLPESLSNGGSAGKDAPSSSLRPSKHYLVKWKSKSHLHCSWICEADIEKAGKSFPGLKMKLNNFRRQIGTLKGSNLEEDWGPIRSEWTTVDRILAHRQTGGIKEYLAKWKELGYEEATWEVESDIAAFQEQIGRYNSIKAQTSGTTSKKRKGSTLANSDSKRWRKDFKAFAETPQFLSGGVLHPYQLEGLNFLRFAWRQGKHVILADEMGLGKTIQSISFLASLKAEGVSFPHLVVAPLSTLRNWEREFAIWAPHLNTVMYVGSGAARAIIREHEFYHPKVKPKMKKKKKFKRKKEPPQPSKQDRIKFDILLTSYEMINLDTATLKPIKWECLVVDEGHRLKNKESKLFQTLTQYITKHRVLLTGTPLQNNMDELFMLMHFLDAGKFASLDEFQQEFNDINQEEQISRLHKMLAPHLLRRVKKDVMKDMPPKKELILRVELSPLQKEYYKAILTKNYEALSRRGGAQISLNNVIMELRKLCGHPYLLEGVEPVVRKVSEAYRQLLEASGKLMLLDKIMVKLKADGHRVLIYSQFKQMLDILEDWLIYKNWTFERIDGSISGSDRQIRIDRFNAKDSTRFCFLLSTRAGGLGINLATADTVIIYDSDWNPHADLQAMARAHRLGQTKKVMIFRLVTRGSIEERMMQLSKKKMVLEHLVVGRLKTQQVLNQEELDDILRYGAKELFAEENDETKSQQIRYDDAAIDRLLDRSQVENEDLNGDDDDRDLLKAFKVANFEYVDEDEATAEGSDAKTGEGAEASDPNGKAKYWDDLLKDRFEEHKYEMLTELGKGKRTRKQVMHLAEDDLAGMSDVSSDDDEEEKEKETDNSPLETARATKETNEPVTKKPQSSKKRTRDLEPSGPPPLLEGEAKSLKVLGFNRRQRATFVQVLMRFGLGDFSWSEFIPRLKPKTLEDIKEYGNLFLGHISEEITESEAFSDGVPKEGLCVQDVLVRLAILHLIQDKVKCFLEDCSAPLFLEEVHSLLPGLDNTKFWNETHDRKLLEALLRHGYGRWHEIADDASLGFDSVVCKELQLPSVSPDVAAPPSNAVSQDTINKENLERNPEQDIPPQGSDGTSHPGSGSNTKDIQLHRKVAEFIKKRATVLERALNAEYHREALAEQREREESGEESTLIEDFPVENDTPFVALFMEEILRNAYDNDPRRLDMARMFNEMCKLVLERETDACETYTGNKSAGIRVRKISREIDSLCTELRRMISPFLKDGVGVHINGASGATAATNQQGASTHLFDCEDQELEGEVESEGDDIATPSQQPGRINQKPPSLDKMGLDGPCINHSKESSHSFTPAEKSSTFFRAPQPSPKAWPPVVILDD